MTRGDFGTILVLLNYIKLWTEQRGKVQLVILTHHVQEAVELTEMISDQIKLIAPNRFLDKCASVLFGAVRIHFYTFSRVYARLVIDYPQALFIYPQPSSPREKQHYSPYIQFFDERLKNIPQGLSNDFIHAYINTRYILDYYLEVHLDYFSLYNRSNIPQKIMPRNLEFLKEVLGISRPYVVMNINCKDNFLSHNRKRIFSPENFDRSIDYLIELGYFVVVQGRQEQFVYRKRKGLINYAHSSFVSATNDWILFSGAVFAIMSKSGPENFTTLCDIPILGVNYVELSSMQPNRRMRFFPKHLRNRFTGYFYSWKELLSAAYFFDVGGNKFSDEIEYIEMSAEEILGAVQEFVDLLSRPAQEWQDYTELQTVFKDELNVLHLDLFHIKGVPCDAYLSLNKNEIEQNVLVGQKTQ